MTALRGMLLVGLLAMAVLMLQLVPGAGTRTTPEPATASAGPPGGHFAIRDVRLFDGEAWHAQANVVVRDGLVVAAGPGVALPKGVPVLDGTGHSLLPGLIDAHVHTWGNARADALRFGVTTLLDMFTDHSQLAAARAERESLEPSNRADLWSAGTLATAAGGHGTQYGMAVPTLAVPADAASWVEARIEEGSDFIKIVREDLAAYGPRRIPSLDDATAAAVIAEAQARGLRAVVHVSLQETARASFRDGAHGLVHVFQDAPADAGLVALARDRGAFVVPTLSVVASMAGGPNPLSGDPRIAAWLSPEQRAGIEARMGFGQRAALLENARESVRRLHAGGVRILAGTDAPNPGTAHGASIHGELLHLVEAGLSPTEALSAATAWPAEAFGLADRGRIAAGLRADLVLVEGDPAADITATRAIVGIWKNGHPVDRSPPAPVAADGVLAPGLLSDFDAGTLAVSQGAGWTPSTDQMAGGRSTVDVDAVPGGAAGSAGAMRVRGEMRTGASFPWSGVMLMPAEQPMQPVDASGLAELVFQVRGDGRSYSVMLFSGGESQGMPSVQPFQAGPEWREVRMRLDGFAGADLARLRGIGFVAGLPEGGFEFQLDAVEFR